MEMNYNMLKDFLLVYFLFVTIVAAKLISNF